MTLPAGTVTFVFTDVEGSTRLLQELGARRPAAAKAALGGIGILVAFVAAIVVLVFLVKVLFL